MLNRVLAVLVTLSLLAMAVFGAVVWTRSPLPLHRVFSDLSLERVIDRNACSGDLGKDGAVSCPYDLCPKNRAAILDAPVFDLPADRLYDIARRYLFSEQRLLPVADDSAARTLSVVQQSDILGLPVLGTIKVVSAGDPDRSSFILTSSPCSGFLRSGGHRARVVNWSSGIERAVRDADGIPSGF